MSATIEKRKKCVIIGSGLGGLSCGAVLSSNGYDVTVLEQQAQTGGCLQCFYRNGVKFETGMHFIGSADRGQVLDRLLRFLGIREGLQLSRLDESAYDIVALGGSRFHFANGREPFIESMAGYFPSQRDNLAKYHSIVSSIAEASRFHSEECVNTDMVLNTEYQLRSINDVLDELITDPLLTEVLVGSLPLYAAVRDKTPFSLHAFITDFYNKSAFRIKGGSDLVGKLIVEKIESFGGRILNRKRAVKIVCNDSRAVGVETEDGCFYDADIVISAIDPRACMGLIDSKIIRPAYKNRIASLPSTVGGFTVYLVFKEGMMPYMNSNLYGYSGSPWGCESYVGDEWPKGYLYMHFEDAGGVRNRAASANAGSGFARAGAIISYMNIADLERWSGTVSGARGADYEKFKRDHAVRLIAEVEKTCPGLSACIETFYTSTPLTYRDYNGTPHGALYGIAKDVTLGPAGRVSHKTKIPNLLLAGQSINSHGILGVLVGSVVACSEVLGSDVVLNEIRRANV